MKLFSKKVNTAKSCDDICQIIKSSAYYFPKGNVSRESFSICCAKRFKGGIISLFPVRGTIIQNQHEIEVTLSLHAGFSFFLGFFLSLIGVTGLFVYFIEISPRWIPSIGLILLGTVICAQFIWEGKALLDILEYKLRGQEQRQTSKTGDGLREP